MKHEYPILLSVRPLAIQSGPAFPLDHDYIEQLWLPIIGPSCTLLWRRLARLGEGYVSLDCLATSIGLGHGVGRNSPLVRSLNRLCDFHAARWNGTTYEVRHTAPQLPFRLVARLPDWLQVVHRELVEDLAVNV